VRQTHCEVCDARADPYYPPGWIGFSVFGSAETEWRRVTRSGTSTYRYLDPEPEVENPGHREILTCSVRCAMLALEMLGLGEEAPR
jgi:hypothetical protein